MTTINDLIEDWIQMRATLQRQLKALEIWADNDRGRYRRKHDGRHHNSRQKVD